MGDCDGVIASDFGGQRRARGKGASAVAGSLASNVRLSNFYVAHVSAALDGPLWVGAGTELPEKVFGHGLLPAATLSVRWDPILASPPQKSIRKAFGGDAIPTP
jgi:hypothetical protein